MSQQIRLKSYVKRSGRLTNSQKKILEKKEYNINFFNSNKILSCQELFNNYNPCILDIGFGDGKLLTDIAKKFQDLNFHYPELMHQNGQLHLSSMKRNFHHCSV